MCKHHYDIKDQSDKSELAKYFRKSHNINGNLNVTILQNNIKTSGAQRYLENKQICGLKTLALHCLNTEISNYAQEIYSFYLFSNKVCHNWLYYVSMITKLLIELLEFAWFSECNCLISSFLYTTFYDLMLYLTSMLCLDNRARQFETVYFLLKII